MKLHCIHNLEELASFVGKINNEQYTYNSSLLSGATLGQHLRHILEFYLTLVKGIKKGHINYDERERNLQLEVCTRTALDIIQSLNNDLMVLPLQKEVKLFGNFGMSDLADFGMNTTVERELLYCYEHSIHHMALMKVAILEQGLSNCINEDFGVAPSTLRNRKICAQ